MMLLHLLAFFIGLTQIEGLNYGYGSQPRAQRSATPTNEWAEQWKQVSDVVPQAPPQKLFVEWPNNVRVQPNDTISTGLSVERPRLVWGTESNTLYTIMFFDGWSDRVLPEGTAMFWVVTNIPGNSVKDGNEVIEYLTPFAVAPKDDGTLEKNILASNHPSFFLAFKQSTGRIVMEETQAGCTPEIISGRVAYYTDLAEKYNLELVAGNYYQNPWSGFWTEQMLCNLTRCIGSPTPFPMPGVNDRPECQVGNFEMTSTIQIIVLTIVTYSTEGKHGYTGRDGEGTKA